MAAAPLQGLAGWGPGLPLVLAWGVCSTLGCTSSPDEDREEWAERLAEFPGVPGAWTAGSEELLGTAGGSRSSPAAIWLQLSDARLSTLRAGDGVAEGGSECERREAWSAVGPSRQEVVRGGPGNQARPTGTGQHMHGRSHAAFRSGIVVPGTQIPSCSRAAASTAHAPTRPSHAPAH